MLCVVGHGKVGEEKPMYGGDEGGVSWVRSYEPDHGVSS
jgi:hypothetical protein